MNISSVAANASKTVRTKGKAIGAALGAGVGVSYILKNRKDIFVTAVKQAPKQLGIAVGAGVSALTIGGLSLAGRTVGAGVDKIAGNTKEENKKLAKNTVKTVIGTVLASAATVATAIALKGKGKLAPVEGGKKITELAKKGLSIVAEKAEGTKLYKKAAKKLPGVVASAALGIGLLKDSAETVLGKVQSKTAFITEPVKKYAGKAGKKISGLVNGVKERFTPLAAGFDKTSKYDAPFIQGLSGKSAQTSAFVFQVDSLKNKAEDLVNKFSNLFKKV